MKTKTYGVSNGWYCSKMVPLFEYFWTSIYWTNEPALELAHERKKENWTRPLLESAYNNYRDNRGNGEAQDTPRGELKYDGKVEWKLQPDGYYHVKYTEGPGDKAWMEEKDLNYLTRLAREGILEQIESTWRDVLSTWEPESKKTAAIKRVDAAIKARAEAERRKAEEEKNYQVRYSPLLS